MNILSFFFLIFLACFHQKNDKVIYDKLMTSFILSNGKEKVGLNLNNNAFFIATIYM